MAVAGGGVDDGDGMQCSEHPYRRGGICAFCLQEKLGKLVSSSSFVRSSTSSSSPTFRSQLPTLRLTPSAPPPRSDDVTNGHHQNGRSRFRLLLTQKENSNIKASSKSNDVVLKRCKSTATPRSSRYLPSDAIVSPRRRRFWSFLHNKPSKPKTLPPPPPPPHLEEPETSPSSSGGVSNAPSFGRKVSRSRSVGCGSRSFSGDFFDRISTGFGDCTIRRIESQREGRRSTSAAHTARVAMTGRVPCGGLFSGFIITSSSSWASTEDQHRAATPGSGSMVNGRNRNWAWAFASPRKVFAKTSISSKDGVTKNNNTSSRTTAPNLAAIPSLLAIRGVKI